MIMAIHLAGKAQVAAVILAKHRQHPTRRQDSKARANMGLLATRTCQINKRIRVQVHTDLRADKLRALRKHTPELDKINPKTSVGHKSAYQAKTLPVHHHMANSTHRLMIHTPSMDSITSKSLRKNIRDQTANSIPSKAITILKNHPSPVHRQAHIARKPPILPTVSKHQVSHTTHHRLPPHTVNNRVHHILKRPIHSNNLPVANIHKVKMHTARPHKTAILRLPRILPHTAHNNPVKVGHRAPHNTALSHQVRAVTIHIHPLRR